MIKSTHKIFDKKDIPDNVLQSMMLYNPEYTKAEMLGLSTRKIPKYIHLYKEKDGKILVPRNYTLPNGYEPEVYEDLMVDGEDVEFQSRIIPREEQVEAIEKLVENENGILEAGAGRGKTVMCLEAIARVGKPALILVHKEFLLHQWKDRVKEFLGEEVGIIQANKCDYKDKKIVIGMIQSLANPDKYPEDMFNYFGIVVTDEVHRVGSRIWSEVIQLFPARRRWGLTATIKRSDGMEIVFMSHIGNVLHTIKGENLTPEIYCIPTQTEVNLRQLVNRWSGQINIPKLITALSEDDERTVLILKNLAQALKSGRQVLVLSERIDHLKGMKKYVDTHSDFTTMLYIGATPQEERDRAGEYDVIFGTMSLAKEGLDIPSLDTLFLTTPTGSAITVQQAVGRIVREYEGKKQPIVLDFVDSQIGICNGLYAKRKKVYNRLKYPIKCLKGESNEGTN